MRLTIDDRIVEVPEGTLIADAAAQAGIEIPVYCYHQALGPLGACRMCLVEVEKAPKLVASCTAAVSEGMVVHTQNAKVDKGRQGVLEFLLINHPLDCPVCDKGGECFLQDYTYRYGPGRGRFGEAKLAKAKDAPLSEHILIDQERCVLCQRCVRFLDEYVGEKQLAFVGRGVETVVDNAGGVPLTSPFSGNVIDLCPVGALLSTHYHDKARPWNIDRKETVCPHCPVGCSATLTARDNKILRMEGRPHPGRDWGWLCDRGRFGYDMGAHPRRLLTGRIAGEETSAALASRKISELLADTVKRYGSGAVAAVIGGEYTTEEAYQIKEFLTNVVGTDRIAISRSVPGYVPMGLNGTFEDLAQSDVVVLIGSDPYDSVPVVHLK
ncbi:MAG: 2Fe-2S iron-sulfur cluster-binding protein, partial [Firmicutes bacterium]|nr:2Fe-2S iron-sulfur cluster-binding protein [Bacillota bacterium]